MAALAVCPRDPGSHVASRSPGDGDFQLSISGDPAKYVPHSAYVGELFSLFNIWFASIVEFKTVIVGLRYKNNIT